MSAPTTKWARLRTSALRHLSCRTVQLTLHFCTGCSNYTRIATHSHSDIAAISHIPNSSFVPRILQSMEGDCISQTHDEMVRTANKMQESFRCIFFKCTIEEDKKECATSNAVSTIVCGQPYRARKRCSGTHFLYSRTIMVGRSNFGSRDQIARNPKSATEGRFLGIANRKHNFKTKTKISAVRMRRI